MDGVGSYMWGLKWSKLFLSLQPTSKQQDILLSGYAAVKKAIRKDRLEDLSSAEVLHIGSLAKQTICKGCNELDVMICFSSSITGENFDTYLKILKKCMETNFPLPIEGEIALYRDRVIFQTTTRVTINLFPSKLFGDIKLVQSANFLTADAVETHVSLISKQDFVFKDLVRVAKYWRDKHCSFSSIEQRPSSTLLELIMFNAYSRYKDKNAPYATIFKAFLKLISNYQKLGIISKSTQQSLGKMPIVQDVGNPVRNLAMPPVHWVEIAQYAQKLISQMDMPDPLATSVHSTLRKRDLVRIIQLLTVHTQTEEETNLTSRLLQQVVRLEERIEELESSAFRPAPSVTPVVPKIIVDEDHETSDKKILQKLEIQDKKLLHLEEKAKSLAVFCSPKAEKKNQAVELSFSPPFDQRVYKKQFTLGGLRWEVLLYPQGKTEEQRGYGSLFFKLLSSHIDDPTQAIFTKIEIASQVLNGTIQEFFIAGAIFGYPKAFEQRKLRAKVDFKIKMSYPTPVSAEKAHPVADKLKRQLYL